MQNYVQPMMVGKRIVKAEYESRYVLVLEFDDGTRARFDLDDALPAFDQGGAVREETDES